MKSLITIVGVLAVLGGLYFLVTAIATPFLYTKTDNAVTQTAVYTIGGYNALVAVSLFAFAGLCSITQRRIL